MSDNGTLKYGLRPTVRLADNVTQHHSQLFLP